MDSHLLLVTASVLSLSFSVMPAAAQSFVDATAAAGLALPPYTIPFLHGTGCSCGDFDGDGDLDLVVPGNPTDPVRYFANDGSGVFTDLTAGSGLGSSGLATACVAADVDNDGDPDLCLVRQGGPISLYINDGSAHFSDEAVARGLASPGTPYGISFGDFDRDGWLDLYLANYADSGGTMLNVLYRNQGDGTFADVTAASGTGPSGRTFVAPFFDYDQDGWPDLFLANDKGYLYTPNQVLRNQEDGTFSDVSAAVNAAQAMDSMGVDFTDAFNDGGQDLYVTDSPPDHLFLVWDPTTGTYADGTLAYGMAGGLVGWACNFLDFDNDGWQDLHVVHDTGGNHLYRNPGAPAAALQPWTEVGAALGTALAWRQAGCLVADLDEDGRLDLLEPMAGAVVNQPPSGLIFLRNQGSAGNWLKVKTEGTRSNRDGLGARVRVTVGALTQTQWVRNGVGFLCGSDHRCHFGLGAATQADRVEITWPSGQVQLFESVAANQVLHAREPRLVLVGTVALGGAATLELTVPGDGGLGYAMALALGTTPGILLPGGRTIPLNLDPVSLFTLTPGNPVLPGSLGALAAGGSAQSPFLLPNLQELSGLTLYAGAATGGPGYPDGVKTILLPLPVVIP